MAGRIVVTGAASGIGAAVTRLAAESGWQVAGLDRSESPSGATHVTADVTDADALRAAVAEVVSDWNAAPDAVVHCAGIYRVTPSLSADPAHWDEVLGINARGSFFAAQAVAATMTSGGSIVLVGSVAAHRGDVGEPSAAYAASKGAVSSLSRQLAVEWGPRGIRVNAVIPGVIDTAMTTVTSDPDATAALLERLPLGRLGEADEVAKACLFLAGADSSYITGTEITVDGGYLAS